MQQTKLFKQFFDKSRKVVITTHYKPDADALGSSLALSAVLKKLAHQVNVITPSDYPDFLNWMPGNSEVLNYENGNQEKSKVLVAEADVIFCLDFNSLKRINSLGESVQKSPAIKVLIDHHLDPDDFAKFQFLDTNYAATCQLLFQLFEDLGWLSYVDADVANCLYAGIMTDTGQFKHPNTTKEVHLATSKLIELGADVAKVGSLIYDNNSIDRLLFIGFALGQRMKVIPDLRTTYFAISAKDLKKFRTRTGDTEGLVNYGLSIKNSIMSALITEREDGVKLSLRSIGSFSVNDFARKHFNGGGHKNAAGGSSDLPFDETIKKFEQLLHEYKKELNHNFNLEQDV